ncbi:MAG: extracellular solute-binding protein [Chromatiaceae bacterium]|nr:extracellular solute-binding protein [Chromatiaceae bacterium]
MKRYLLSGLLFAVLLAPLPAVAEEVVVYSARNEHLIKPLFDRYTSETGVEIRYITDQEGPLLQRLKAEGQRTPADMLITVDAGNLWHAAETGVLAEIRSAVLEANVPANLRDPQGRWFGLSERARTIVYSTERVKPADLSSYEDLADRKWKGRLCLRTSKKVYNQSLVATLIARHGEDKAEQIVRGWVDNLAAAPFSNDTKAMQAVAAGQCDVTVVNTYYFGRLQKDTPDLKLAIFWPNQDSSGVHINVSGAGVTRYAKHPEAAQKLLEWLSSEEAQGDFAGLNMEYPVNPKVAPDAMVAAWGSFKADELNVNEAGRLQTAAIRLMDRAGYR